MANGKRLLLKQLRVSQGDASQEKFSEMIGVDRQYYSKVENGKIRGNEAFWMKLQERFGLSDGDIWRMMKE